jgi:methylglyoxal synthase
VDVKALMRLAIVYDIAMALNLATAGMVLGAYEAGLPGAGQDNESGNHGGHASA